MYPQLENDKQKIINKFKEKKNTSSDCMNVESIEKKKDIILEQFNYDGQIYYMDHNYSVWNDKYELIGSISERNDEGIPTEIYFFNDDILNINNLFIKYN